MAWPNQRWNFAPAPDASRLRVLREALGFSAPLVGALIARGIDTPELAEAHLAPSLARIVAPEQLPGVAEADALIRAAIDGGEEILVFGDFDADGTCASAVLAGAITGAGGKAEIFLPDRLSEGYGLSPEALERALSLHPGTKLLVTVDCGITQHAGVAACRERGVRVVITDHHLPARTLPEADVVINPHLPGTPEALRDLAGVGVAFKLAHILSRRGGRRCFDPATLLPLVALGTVADMAPLTGENRLLVHAGLERLNRGENTGLKALAAVAGIKESVLASDLGFRLGPRVNAAGRIDDPMLAVRLFMTRDVDAAAELAGMLDGLNQERQNIERKVCDEAIAQHEKQFDPERHRAAVVWGEGWHPGVVGLAAGRLCQRYRLPAIALQMDESGEARGSARCPDVEGLDLMELLAPCAHLLERYGGHRAAAGVGLKREKVREFAAAFQVVCAEKLEGRDLRPTLDIDAWVEPGELDLDFHNETLRLEPCGNGNPPVRWALRGAELAEAPKALGAEGRHFRLTLRGEGGSTLSAVFFNVPHPLDEFEVGAKLDVAFTTRINTYWGEPDLQLLVDDLRPSETAPL